MFLSADSVKAGLPLWGDFHIFLNMHFEMKNECQTIFEQTVWEKEFEIWEVRKCVATSIQKYAKNFLINMYAHTTNKYIIMIEK